MAKKKRSLLTVSDRFIGSSSVTNVIDPGTAHRSTHQRVNRAVVASVGGLAESNYREQDLNSWRL